MAPAMGTVLAAMQGDRFPIMHPVLGLIGYSNAPQPRQQVGWKFKKKTYYLFIGVGLD